MSDLQDLQELEDLGVEPVEEPPKPLQKPKIKKGEKPVTEDAKGTNGSLENPPLSGGVGVQEGGGAPLVKTKKPKTEKQIEAFNKAREKMLVNLKERKERQAQEEMQRKKEIEEKIVKKAIAIKKKEIKQKAILEEISDDETPIEVVKKIAKKIQVKTQPVEPEKPLTIFEKYRFI